MRNHDKHAPRPRTAHSLRVESLEGRRLLSEMGPLANAPRPVAVEIQTQAALASPTPPASTSPMGPSAGPAWVRPNGALGNDSFLASNTPGALSYIPLSIVPPRATLRIEARLTEGAAASNSLLSGPIDGSSASFNPSYHPHDAARLASFAASSGTGDLSAMGANLGSPWRAPFWGLAAKFADTPFFSSNSIAVVGLSPRFPGWSDLTNTSSYFSSLGSNANPPAPPSADGAKGGNGPADPEMSLLAAFRTFKEGGGIGPMNLLASFGEMPGPIGREGPIAPHPSSMFDVVAGPAETNGMSVPAAGTGPAIQTAAARSTMENLGGIQVRIPIVEFVAHIPISSTGSMSTPAGPLGGAKPVSPAPHSGQAAFAPRREQPNPPIETTDAEFALASPDESDILTQILPFERGSIEYAIDRVFTQLDGFGEDLFQFEDSLNLVPASMAFAVAISASGIALWLYRRPPEDESRSTNSRSIAGDDEFNGMPGPWSWSEI